MPPATRIVAASGKTLIERFLATLSITGNPSAACRASTMTRRQLNVLLETDPDFALGYQEALDDAADMLEAEAWRRALEGTPQPVLNFGKPVLDPETGSAMIVRRYSDTLLMLLLRGSKPEKFSLRGSAGGGREDPMLVLKEIATDDDPPRRCSTPRQARPGPPRKP